MVQFILIPEAYNAAFGTNGRNIVTLLSIITTFSTIVIGVLGVSRLFHKLSEKGIAPKYLSKLVSLDKMLQFKGSSGNNDSKPAIFDKMPTQPY